MVCSVCTTLLALALCAVSIFHLFINFDGYAAGEINWNDIYCSNNRRQHRDHSAISMMTINKWRWQEPNNFHIWPIAKHKISLITWIISYFIYCIYYVLTKHVAKPQAYGQQVKGNAIENQNKTSQWLGRGLTNKRVEVEYQFHSIRFHSIRLNSIRFWIVYISTVSIFKNNSGIWIEVHVNEYGIIQWFLYLFIDSLSSRFIEKKSLITDYIRMCFNFSRFSPPPQNWLA